MSTRILIPVVALMTAVPGEDLPWESMALCAEVDPEIFFPERGASAAPARRICRACEVRPECLDYALEHDEQWGVWAGTTRDERLRLKRQRLGEAA